MNNETFLIDNEDLTQAKKVCKYITEPVLRNRGVANALAAQLASKYFQGFDVDVKTGIHNISQVLEKHDISDVYINDAYVDVRLYFEENQIFVPKSHFANNTLPVAYMFIKLSNDLSDGTVVGFVLPENIDKSNEINGYYQVREDNFVSFYDVEPLLISEGTDSPDDLELLIYTYLDGILDDDASLLKLMLANKDARLIFKNISRAQNLFKHVSVVEPKREDVSEIKSSNDVNVIEENFEDSIIITDGDNVTLEITDDENSFALDSTIEENSEENFVTESDDFLIEENFDDGTDNSMNFDLETTSDDSAEDLFESNNEELLIEEESYVDESESIELNLEPDINEDFSTVESTEDIIEVDSEYNTINETIIDESIEELSMDESIDISNESDDVSQEPEYFEYSTMTTPSIDVIENDDVLNEIAVNDDIPVDENLEADEILDEVVLLDNNESSDDVTEKNNENSATEDSFEDNINEYDSIDESNKEEINESDDSTITPDSNIDTLFNPEQDDYEEEVTAGESIKQKSRIPLILVVALVASLGYLGATKFILPMFNDTSQEEYEKVQTQGENHMPPTPVPVSKDVAMPVETVENVKTESVTNEATSNTIDAVEKNLDASINVSNLTVSWEVPSGYVNNSIAKRYFTKIGKIIQLNLKSELLLMMSQPLNDKIAVELEYNSSTTSFTFKKITISSGDATVDKVVEKTIRNALDINSNSNMTVFKDIQGNPLLVIKL